MKQIEFWGTWNDTFSVLADLLDMRIAIAIPDVPFGEDGPKKFTMISDELKEILVKRPKLEFWTPSALEVPFDVGRWNTGPYAGMRYLRTGGPVVSFYPPACYLAAEKPVLMLASGSVACGHVFADPRTGREEEMPSDVREWYEICVKRIKKQCVRIGAKKRWVGHDAARQVEAGIAEFKAPHLFE